MQLKVRLQQLPKTILSIIVLLAAVSAAAAAPLKVAILPFTINSDKDYTFLQNGIGEMLTSRLSEPGRVDIVDPGATAEALRAVHNMSGAMTGDNAALLTGARLKADYVIHGSVTSLGDSVSLDAKMLDISGTRPPLTFFKQTQSMGEVIPQINLLATEINSRVFGLPAAGPAVTPTPAPAGQVPLGDIHAHPEKMLQEGQIIGDLEGAGRSPLAMGEARDSSSSSLNPAFTTTAGGAAPQFWKSQNLPHLINGLDVGDVNQDGRLDLVVAAADALLVYQVEQGRMRQLAKIAPPAFTVNIAVDVGDFDGNGVAEIYVTAYSAGYNALQSYVVEYSGGQFKIRHSGLRWYFRLVQSRERGLVLLGQKQLIDSAPNSSPIVELEYNGVDYLPTKTLLPAGRANLIGFTTGRLAEGQETQMVAFEEWDKLQLFDARGKQLWKSSDSYGGTPLALMLPPGADRQFDSSSPTPLYLPVRVRTAELDKGGPATVIVAQNKELADRKMARQRFYNKGKIVGMQWDGLGLVPAWQTRELSGRIQDLCIADFDNDGTLELVAAVVSKEGAIIATEPKSSVIAYKLKLE